MAHFLILYGEMGSGKSYWSSRLWSYLNSLRMKDSYPPACLVEGDDYISSSMVDKINSFELLSTEDIDNFIHVRLAGALLGLAKKHDVLVVSQALYRYKNRVKLRDQLEQAGHTVEFLWVKTATMQNIKQLRNRENSWSWIFYYLFNKLFFQGAVQDRISFHFYKNQIVMSGFQNG